MARVGGQWQLWIDTGGTFTDCLALDPAGELRRVKVLSSGTLRAMVVEQPRPDALVIEQGWGGRAEGVRGLQVWPGGGAAPGATGRARVISFDRDGGALSLDRPLEAPSRCPYAVELGGGEEAPVLAARLVTGTARDAALPPLSLRLATTRGTNALLERRGARVALAITRGFGDTLLIRDQQRPDLFQLSFDRPPALYDEVIEIDERIAADGVVLRPLRWTPALAEQVRRLVEGGIDVVAVALVNSFVNSAHERQLAGWLREAGLADVRCSAALTPAIGLLRRAETAVVDSYLAPVITRFLGRVGAALPEGSRENVLVMTSAGGLARASRFAAKDSLLSGPAAGVVGAARAGARCRDPAQQLISFDMGGTSTDVARYADGFDYRFRQRVGDAELATTALAIESVAAGGGSICSLSGDGRLTVGPESAGADPGPACYGAGGPLTLTDVNLLLGRFDPTRFSFPLRREAAEAACEALRRQIVGGEQIAVEALLEGLLAIANERMAEAIKQVSLRRGYAAQEHTLVAFGGAGPQHACAVAELLGISRVVVPEDAGLLSASGLGQAALERIATRQPLRPLAQLRPALPRICSELIDEARAAVVADGGAPEAVETRLLVNLRLVGQDATLTVRIADLAHLDSLRERFARSYRDCYGHDPPEREVEVESLRAVASAREDGSWPAADVAAASAKPRRSRTRCGGRWQQLLSWDREQLAVGRSIEGPALVVDRYGTTFVGSRWRAEVDPGGALVLVRGAGAPARAAASAAKEAAGLVRVELFAQRLTAIADEMGEMLRRTALSTNVKERLDFSCALLDSSGQLVVNAPHIPVHLGSLGLCVRRVIEELRLAPGDVVVTNHPAYGGSHLPDVTVIGAVHSHRGRLLGYVANRAHHAEIGGRDPGSMSPRARCLAEEGVVIAPRYLLRAGRADWAGLRALLSAPPWPSRALVENLADLRAALAANEHGRRALARVADEGGAAVVGETMARLAELAARQAREALARLPDGERVHRSTLDDGSPLCVKLRVVGDRAVLSFAGSGPVHPGNLNATPAIVRSAVLYALRLLIGRPLPLNEGILEPVTIELPRGMLAPQFTGDPRRDPAVAGGNVETSQRLVDGLVEALGLAANSQGTMNNVIFGDERFSYYETLGGGGGAGPGFDGPSAVHCHMTNTRITDVEVLEHRYPVRLERFAVRRGSGGPGRHRGGDGLLRELTFLAPATLSLLTQRRATRPRGLAGGRDGAGGFQRLERAGGESLQLAAIDHRQLDPGDRLLIGTPGGGGYGDDVVS